MGHWSDEKEKIHVIIIVELSLVEKNKTTVAKVAITYRDYNNSRIAVNLSPVRMSHFVGSSNKNRSNSPLVG